MRIYMRPHLTKSAIWATGGGNIHAHCLSTRPQKPFVCPFHSIPSTYRINICPSFLTHPALHSPSPTYCFPSITYSPDPFTALQHLPTITFPSITFPSPVHFPFPSTQSFPFLPFLTSSFSFPFPTFSSPPTPPFLSHFDVGNFFRLPSFFFSLSRQLK